MSIYEEYGTKPNLVAKVFTAIEPLLAFRLTEICLIICMSIYEEYITKPNLVAKVFTTNFGVFL